MLKGSAIHWVAYRLDLRPANTQLTQAERTCIASHAPGKRSLVEIGVMQGATTALLRSVMDPQGTITGIDPHPPGRLGVNFERWVAVGEMSKYPRGKAILLRCLGYEAAPAWTAPIDFLFIDGNHSWVGIDRDWRDWSGHIMGGGLVALHDSRSVPGRRDCDSVRYTQEVILADRRLCEIDSVDSLTVLQRVPRGNE